MEAHPDTKLVNVHTLSSLRTRDLMMLPLFLQVSDTEEEIQAAFRRKLAAKTLKNRTVMAEDAATLFTHSTTPQT